MSDANPLLDNPFLVLGILPNATRIEVERAGQKLLAQLAVQVASAKTYATPHGPRARDEDRVRAALAALRDPGLRVMHELWLTESAGPSAEVPSLPAWSEAWRSMGWRTPCPR
jgi:hypothetical protein